MFPPLAAGRQPVCVCVCGVIVRAATTGTNRELFTKRTLSLQSSSCWVTGHSFTDVHAQLVTQQQTTTTTTITTMFGGPWRDIILFQTNWL